MGSAAPKDLLDTQTHSGASLRPPAAPLPLMPGQILLDKYEVERILGVGGMGVVVSAIHLELGERVAIKAMLPEVAVSRDHATRFAREAQAAARIKSEFVARVTDVARLPDGTPFMVMEHLEGETLATYLDRNGRLPVETAVDTLLEACVALAEAHRLGIVHRDVKPANLFVAQQPGGGDILKVLDFGISKSDENMSITRTAGALGTPAYMSPEQLRAAGTVRPTADIWSLGVVLFEMLTGELPYEAKSFADICALVLVSPPRTPRSIEASIPEALEAAILRCLQREQLDRFQSVPELARALAPFASEEGCGLIARIELIGSARASMVSLDEAPASGRRTFSSLSRNTPRTPRTPRTSAFGAESPASRSGVRASQAPRSAVSDTPTAQSVRPRAASRIWIGAVASGCLLGGAAWVAFRHPTVEMDLAASSLQSATIPTPAAAPVASIEPVVAPVASASPSASASAPLLVAPLPGRAPAAAPGGPGPSRGAPLGAKPADKPHAASKLEDFGGRK